MLSRHNRVSTALCTAILKGGRSISSVHFSLRYLKGEKGAKSGEYPRFSVVVSKKVAKLAVRRNALRRKIYGILGEKDFFPTLPPVSALIMVKKDIITEAKDIKEIKTEIADLLAKISR